MHAANVMGGKGHLRGVSITGVTDYRGTETFLRHRKPLSWSAAGKAGSISPGGPSSGPRSGVLAVAPQSFAPLPLRGVAGGVDRGEGRNTAPSPERGCLLAARNRQPARSGAKWSQCFVRGVAPCSAPAGRVADLRPLSWSIVGQRVDQRCRRKNGKASALNRLDGNERGKRPHR